MEYEVYAATESTDAVLDEIWHQHCSSESWNFITNSLHNGDLFFVLTMIRYFKVSQRSSNTRVRFIADSPGKFAILKLFQDELDYIAYERVLASLDSRDIAGWAEKRGRSEFAAGSMQRLHPQDLAGGYLPIAPIVYSKGLFNLLDLFKVTLKVPLSISPIPPLLKDVQNREALSRFRHFNLAPGRTLILFPYAQTIPFNAEPVMRRLAAKASDLGFVVCTAIHGTEQPIDGTLPIQITFDIIIQFCELAGYVVSLRSGICDMLACAKLTKVYLYQDSDFARYENPNSYGICDCSHAIVYENENESVDVTSSQIMTALTSNRFASAIEFCPFVVLRYLTTLGASGGTTVFDYQHGCKIGRYVLFPGAVLADGWSEVEQWGVWSIGYRSVLYLKMPSDETSLSAPTFLEIDFCTPGYDVQFSIEINGREASFSANELIKISIELTHLEKATGCHRVVIDVPKPNISPDYDRILGIGLRKAVYSRYLDRSATLWPDCHLVDAKA